MVQDNRHPSPKVKALTSKFTISSIEMLAWINILAELFIAFNCITGCKRGKFTSKNEFVVNLLVNLHGDLL